MITKYEWFFIIFIAFVSLHSCSTLEKSSSHGFESGYYKLNKKEKSEKVYVDVNEETLKIYSVSHQNIVDEELTLFPQKESENMNFNIVKLSKKSLDIDITSTLLKYRTNNKDHRDELTSDFNLAIYAGPRFDQFKISNKTDALGKKYLKVSNKAVDFGIFAGIGTTIVSPYSTSDRFDGEYNGMCMQIGLAGFIESNAASFGISYGYDYLLNRDKKIWIYQNQPWIGFIVGIALN